MRNRRVSEEMIMSDVAAFARLFQYGRTLEGNPHISPLVLQDLSSARMMTFPTFRPLLDQCLHRTVEKAPVVNALVARQGAEPIGMVLSRLPVPHCFQGTADSETPKIGTLLSVYVAPAWRQRGVAGQLLRALENEAVQHGCNELGTNFTTLLPAWQIFERLLAGCQWFAPEPGMLLSKAKVVDILRAPWMNVQRTPPPGCSLFPWMELRPSERAQLEGDVAAGKIPRGLSPFADEKHGEPTISTGIRQEGEVVAWMTVIRSPFEPKALCYRSAFVQPQLRTGNALGPLAMESAFRRHAASPIAKDRPETVAGFSLQNSNSMINFYRKWVEPYCFCTYESRWSVKRIKKT